jgi:hypothetical protein
MLPRVFGFEAFNAYIDGDIDAGATLIQCDFSGR